METIHTVLIRYNLFLKKLKSWQITRTDIDTYKRDLFDSERLQERLELFKSFTIPSLIQQDLIGDCIDGTEIRRLQVFLATSDQLPENHKREIEELSNKYRWLNVCYLSEDANSFDHIVTDYIESLYSQLHKPILYSNMRLDDDDALSYDFLNRLEKFTTEENIGRAISFANGYFGVYDSEHKVFTHFCQRFTPKIALGLALINRYDNNGYSDNKMRTIYRAGAHLSIDKYIPVILDSRKPAYIRTIHNHADSYNEKKMQQLFNRNDNEHPLKIMQYMGMTFPFLFDSMTVNINESEMKSKRLHEFVIKDKSANINLTIQMCVWNHKVLIQLSKRIPEGSRLELTIRKGDKDLTGKYTIDCYELRLAMDLINGFIDDYESEPLSFDIKLCGEDFLYRRAFDF